MNFTKSIATIATVFSLLLISCSSNNQQTQAAKETAAEPSVELPTEVMADHFADIQVLRYGIPGWNELTPKQKELGYYLYMAGRSGRDIFFDQKYKYNLTIRKALEAILNNYKGDTNGDEWKNFETYSRQFFFANGMHHHYSNDKILPKYSKEYFATLVKGAPQDQLPLQGKTADEFVAFITPIMFDPNIDKKCVDLSADIDNLKASTVNYYEGVTKDEAEKFYADMSKGQPKESPSFGLNSKLVKENGTIVEKKWMVGGMYSPAIEKIVFWLEKAINVAENDIQKNTLKKLVEYFKTGDLKKFDEYSISWVGDTVSRMDAVIGFIENYHDPIAKHGSYESVVSMKDMEATKMIAKIAAQAQWFEDHSSIMDNHKKKKVVGISAKVITVIGESGDGAPATPIGINLPNAEWIREQHGSKSVSLGNIVAAYNYARAKSPVIDEFGIDDNVKKIIKEHGALCADLHTDMHEVIGHASGQINPGVGNTDVTLKNYASCLEEARADLVALYYIMDTKLVDMGIMPSLEVGKAQYYSYLLNGLMTQLYRINPKNNIEEAHMRNRQLISKWVLEKGQKDKVVEIIERDKKHFIQINDYNKLRELFGQLLREIQRIKSEGDFNAGKNLVENYGVIADQKMLAEVHQRYEKLGVAPYMGFIQPKLIPVMDGDKIIDVKIDVNQDFLQQMLEYGKDFGFLPVMN
ncbi:MAG: dihydrofolate reductase [Bacteroidetes bacterium]|nr:dihydrofolate reductase [Bacteroidota bacterium]